MQQNLINLLQIISRRWLANSFLNAFSCHMEDEIQLGTYPEIIKSEK